MLPPSLRYQFALLLFTWLFSQHQVSAGELRAAINDSAQILSQADLEQIALQNNPALASAAARIDAAYGHYLQAGLLPNPVAGYHATEIGNLGTAGQQGGFVSQRVITAGKLRLDQTIACFAIEEAESLFDVQEQRVLNDVRIRFYDALVARKRLELAGELSMIAAAQVHSTQQLLDARQASENDLLQAEIEAESIHILQDNARNENVESWRRLSAVIGMPQLKMTQLAGDLTGNLPNYSWEQSYHQVLGENAELDAARARIDQAIGTVDRSRREAIPNIDFSVSVRHHNVTQDDVANVQIGVPLPLFDRNQGHIARSEARLIDAENDFRRVEVDLQDRLAVAYRKYLNAQQQQTRYSERILPRAKRSLELVSEAYRKGQADYLTLITAQRTYVRVNLSYLDAVQMLRNSAVEIEGQLLSGSLKK